MEVLSYSCIACKKDYGTYKNLWTHNKSRYNGIKTVKVAYEPELFQCRKCDNVFNHVQSRHTHEKSCGAIVRTELELEFEKYREINREKEKENVKLEIKLRCLRDEAMREKQKRKKEDEGIKKYIQEEKEERSRIEKEIKDKKEETNRIEKENEERQRKLRHLLLALNQARIQSKFC
jgi:hypothetical protein